MKNKKIFTVIVAGGLVFGISTAFAAKQPSDQSGQDPSTQSSQEKSTQVTPPSTGGLNEPSGAAAAAPFDKEKFVKESAQGALAEVNVGQLATQKAQDPAIKEFAQKLVTDHSGLVYFTNAWTANVQGDGLGSSA